MRRTLSSARRLLNRVTLGLFLAQVATMVLLTVLESFRKKQRKLRRFPVTAPESLHVNRNEVTVYTYGADLYDAMIAAIDAATDHVYFETYIWKGDEAG
ncbi:MAG: phosphatidylserine/phosphatidylglycerophosphate/cardiolipin synthase family protein, partial [Propionibacteriaceae bacterium]|nr:phosphatidylserine/phosphatidylglycerophosphate/cardiolipin synthase family protein [Propionibacteriaceae bacterium]